MLQTERGVLKVTLRNLKLRRPTVRTLILKKKSIFVDFFFYQGAFEVYFNMYIVYLCVPRSDHILGMER